MSYDYLLYRAKRGAFVAAAVQLFSGKLGQLLAITQSLDGPPIGTIDEVKAAVSRVFPDLQWRKMGSLGGLVLPISDIDWGWHTAGAPEIGLGADSSGLVRLMSMSRADPAEVKRVAKTLNLRVIDEQ